MKRLSAVIAAITVLALSTWATSQSFQTITDCIASGSITTCLKPVNVASGGTGLTSGTSGGIPAYTGSTTITSSGALTANAVVIGGGAGTVPTIVTNNSTGTNEFLTQSSSGAPAWATIVAGDVPSTLNATAITGVTDGSNAAAGKVGEVITAASGNVSVTTSATAMTNITVTHGDWDVIGNCQSSGGTTQLVLITISTVSSTSQTAATVTAGMTQSYMASQGGGGNASLYFANTSSGSVQYFINAQAGTSTATMNCFMTARRRR